MTESSTHVMDLVALWAAVVSALVLVLACTGVFVALILRMSAGL